MKFYNKKPIVGLFIMINILYLTHGFLPGTAMVYGGMLFAIFTFSLYYMYRVNVEFNNSHFIKALNVLVLLITVYGIFHLFEPLDATLQSIPDYRPYTYITNAYRPLLQIYPLYYFSRKGYIDEKVIKSWIIPSFIAVAIAFYVKETSLLVEMTTVSDDVVTTNNTGYLVLSLFPLLYFIKKDIIKYAALVVVSVFVFISAKRGAILIGGLSIVCFFYFNFKSSMIKKRLWVILFMGIAGLFLYIYLYNIYMENSYFQYLYGKSLDGKSSGRDVLYSRAWSSFIQAPSFINTLIGYGANSTYHLLGNRAHNDWFEFMVNQGLLGLIVYAIFWVELFKVWRESKTQRFVFIVFSSVLLIFFFKSIFSMMYNDLSAVACLPFAWCLAVIDSKPKRYKRKTVIV